MKKIAFLLLITIPFIVFNSCEDDDETIDYVTFESSSYNFGVELNGTTTNDIKIYTTKTSGVDRTFNINVSADLSSADPASYDIPSSVTVPANSNIGIIPVTISDLNIGEEGETLVLEIEPTDGLFIGERITLNIKQVCPLNEVILNITFDDWPEETGWELLDSDNNTVASAEIGSYAGQTSFSKAFCLEDGTYTFTIYDAYGDGTNSYSLIYNNTEIVSGGAFGESETTTFDVSM
ncbi:MAG: hypothetical protein ABFS12_13570 [Bacteroidota bacterium]